MYKCMTRRDSYSLYLITIQNDINTLEINTLNIYTMLTFHSVI